MEESMKAQDFMTKNVSSCIENQTVEDAANLMLDKHYSVVPVVDSSGVLVGILTQSDFISKEVEVPHALASLKLLLGVTHYNGDVEEIYANSKKRLLKDIMTKNLKTVAPDTSLDSVVALMEDQNLKRIPVVEDNKLVGIITRRDLLRAFRKSE
jgi:CBS domain-containing protein